MEISINHQNLQHIRRKVESGRYKSPDDVLAKALALLDEREEALAGELENLRADIQEGIDALKNGDYTEYSDETIHEFFSEVARRGHEWLKSRDNASDS